MKAHRVWVEIVGLVTVIACMLALVIATFGAAGAAVGTSEQPEKTTHAAVESPSR